MENEIVKRELGGQSFIERLIENADGLEKIKEVGMVIINSGFCPEHFKQSKDAVGAIMCIEAGRKLGLTWMQSLSDIYPVKGRIGIMGSAARSVIFSCGILDKWEEITEGTYPEDTYKHIIISKRKGLPGEFRSEFSVYDAKKAGLFSKDIYQRYGKRMVMWRNIGFHATDYYGDIMKGMRTVEELADFDVIPGVGDTTIEKEDGTKINITGGSKGKSTKMTERVADKIKTEGFAPVQTQRISDAEVVPETLGNGFDDPLKDVIEKSGKDPQVVLDAMSKAVDKQNESPFIPSKSSTEFLDGKEVNREEKKEEVPGQYTLAGMEAMDTEVLKKIVMADMDLMEGAEMIGGKNTNKKLREIIFAHQNNGLKEYVAEHLPKPETIAVVEPPVNTQAGEIPLNKDFDKQGPAQGTPTRNADVLQPDPPKEKVVSGNKYGIEIPEAIPRDFSIMKSLHNKFLMATPTINNSRYEELAEKLHVLMAFPDKETFLKNATAKMVNELLDSN